MTKCYDTELLLIDYLDNQLSETSKKAVDAHIQSCEHCRKELDAYKEIFNSIASEEPVMPGIGLKENFDTMLQSEINILATTRIIDPVPRQAIPVLPLRTLLLRVAACIFLMATGIIIGSVVTAGRKEHSNSAQMALLQTEVKEMKETMMLNLLNDESASERIKAVTYVEQMNNPGEDVLKALINTLNLDQNVNVRLAALNTVSRFSSSPLVRDSLVNSLRNQKEPIVQIVLINILTDKKEPKAVGPLKEILSDESTLAPVKDAATKGLKVL